MPTTKQSCIIEDFLN